MKKLIAGILAILIAVSLTACSTDEEVPPTPQDSNFRLLDEHPHVLEDGRTVTCIVYKSGYAGGLSCDWEGAR